MTNLQITEEITKVLTLNAIHCDMDLKKESENFQRLFDRYPEFFSQSNLLSALGKRPFDEVINPEGLAASAVDELRRCYETISPECFVPFYEISDDDMPGEFDFDEEQLRFGEFLLRQGIDHEPAYTTSLTKDFPSGALVSLRRIIERFGIGNKWISENAAVILARFLKDLRKAPVLLCNDDFKPKHELGGARGISDLAEICDGSDELFDFIYNHEFVKDVDHPDAVYNLLPGLRFVKDAFDKDVSRIMSLLTKEIKRPFWYHQNFEDFCIALRQVKEKDKVLNHLEDNITVTKREASKRIGIRLKKSETFEDYDLEKEVMSVLTGTYLTRVCGLIEEGNCGSFDEIDECASLEVPGYKIVRRLGQGVDGVVYQARHDILEDVKIKIFNSPKDKMKKAMEAEGISLEDRIRRRIAVFDKVVRDKSFLTQFYEVGRCADPSGEGRTVYTVGDYVDGGALEKVEQGKYIVRSDIVDSLDAVPIIYKALIGLEAIHDAGLVLRDIKLSNILVSNDHRVVRIDDIETVAGMQELHEGLRLTEGSDRYAAPEVMLDVKNASPQSDVYSMAVCLIYLLTKNPTLFLGVNTLPIEGYNERLGEILDIIPKSDMSATERLTFLTALSYQAENRFKDAREFRRALINPLGYLRRNSGSSVDDFTEEFWMSMDRQKAEELRRKDS
jgi:serine/threonine protein kinase